MSLHTYRCEFVNSHIHPSCACGWKGDPQEDVSQAINAYSSHVEEALGADAYYNAPVACANCGSEHQQGLIIGTDVWTGTCDRCGVERRLRPNNVWIAQKDVVRD